MTPKEKKIIAVARRHHLLSQKHEAADRRARLRLAMLVARRAKKEGWLKGIWGISGESLRGTMRLHPYMPIKHHDRIVKAVQEVESYMRVPLAKTVSLAHKMSGEYYGGFELEITVKPGLARDLKSLGISIIHNDIALKTSIDETVERLKILGEMKRKIELAN